MPRTVRWWILEELDYDYYDGFDHSIQHMYMIYGISLRVFVPLSAVLVYGGSHSSFCRLLDRIFVAFFKSEQFF